MARSRRTSSRAVIVLVVLVLGLALALAAAIGSQGFTNKNVKSWFNGWGNLDNVGDPGDNISIVSYSLMADEYAAYGISEEAIAAGVITAEYQPSNATNKRTDWVWRWSGNNEWSNGKILSDYVDFTAGAGYAPQVTYSVKQPFGDTIIVEATSRANSELKATTNVDYLAQYDVLNYGGDITLDYHEDLNLYEYFTTDDVYSVVPDAYSAQITVSLDNSFWQWRKAKYDDCDVAELYTVNDITETLSWETWACRNSEIQSNVDFPIDSMFAEYYNETGYNIFFIISTTVTCYYKGENMYTFTDMQGICFSSEALALMAVPPTSVTTPDQIVVNPNV